VRHADMPLTPANVWRAIQGRPLRTDLALPWGAPEDAR
jgi:aerobic carbon-monoxide dehydrogenase large subunit